MSERMLLAFSSLKNWGIDELFLEASEVVKEGDILYSSKKSTTMRNKLNVSRTEKEPA